MAWYWWALIAAGYGAFFWFLYRFFATVKTWDDEIKRMTKGK